MKINFRVKVDGNSKARFYCDIGQKIEGEKVHGQTCKHNLNQHKQLQASTAIVFASGRTTIAKQLYWDNEELDEDQLGHSDATSCLITVASP